MGIELLRSLLESTTSFLQLSSSGGIKFELAKTYYQMIEELLKFLKSTLDAIVDLGIGLDEEKNQTALAGLCQSLDELKEIFGKWEPLMSKLYFVLQVEPLITRILNHSSEILEELRSLNSILPDELRASSFENFIQEMKQFEHISPFISKAITDHVEGFGASSQNSAKITSKLSLESSQELLIEAIALQKIQENAEQAEETDKDDYIGQLIGLITNMHDQLVSMKQSQTHYPVPIPADFLCPLSLDLMADPVIVESGQTYERSFIEKWINLGLDVCPKTRQPLANTILIPNGAVKALISHWCKSNNIMFPDPTSSTCTNQTSVLLENADSVRITKDNTSGRPEHSFDFLATSPVTSKAVSSAAVETSPDLLEVESRVKKLAQNLKCDSVETQRIATSDIRFLARSNADHRSIIAKCGVIDLLVGLLRSPDLSVQENSVTALLNLSINDNNKTAIAEADAVEPIIQVLETGTPEAKQNSAATLFNLSAFEDNRVKIGESGAIEPLVNLLGSGTLRGRKDAANALFNLSINRENKGRIVQTDAVRHLVELLDPAFGMVAVSVAVLANLSTVFEGRTAIARCGGIPLLVEVLELGSERAKENAAAALLQMCIHSNRYRNMMLKEGLVPPLVTLSRYGTQRAREKSQQLLGFFKNQSR